MITDGYNLDAEPIDTISFYLEDIKGHKLLTQSDEQRLFGIIEAGRRAAACLAEESEPRPEDKESWRKLVIYGEKAKETVFIANTRLVISVAKKYRGHLPFSDLIQEGNCGLLTAIEKFEVKRGYKFSTYAVYWVRQSIGRSVFNQSRNIRVPVHRGALGYQINVARERFKAENGYAPDNETIAEMVAGEHTAAHIERTRVLIETTETYSLDQAIGTEDSSSDTLHGTASDDVNISAGSEASDLTAAITKVLETLPPREQTIISLRFGLKDGAPLTLEEVGQKFGLTRERIRQIEAGALKKLRHPRRSRPLRDFARE